MLYILPAWAADVEVQMVEGSATDINSWTFNPAEVTINAGDTVTFRNTGSQQHTATSTTGAFDTGLIPAGESKAVVVAAPGSYPFVCTPHPWMKGTLTVNAAAAPAAAAPAAQPAPAAKPTAPLAVAPAAAAPVAKPAAQAVPTPTPFRLVTQPATTATGGTVAPRAGSLPMEMALPLLVGGGAAALAGAGLLLRRRR
jgi:plastocyanin